MKTEECTATYARYGEDGSNRGISTQRAKYIFYAALRIRIRWILNILVPDPGANNETKTVKKKLFSFKTQI